MVGLVWSGCLAESLSRIAPDRATWARILSARHSASLPLLRSVADCLDGSRLRWCLCGGSLLGAVRHGGFIPWDDDVDLAILVPYDRSGKFERDLWPNCLMRLASRKDVVVRTLHTHTQIRREIAPDVFVHVDLFVLRQEQPNGPFVGNALFRFFAPAEYFTADEVATLRMYPFENDSFPGPNDAAGFLRRSYPGFDRQGLLQWPQYWGETRRHLRLDAATWPHWKLWWASASLDWLFPWLRARYELTPDELSRLCQFLLPKPVFCTNASQSPISPQTA